MKKNFQRILSSLDPMMMLRGRTWTLLDKQEASQCLLTVYMKHFNLIFLNSKVAAQFDCYYRSNRRR